MSNKGIDRRSFFGSIAAAGLGGAAYMASDARAEDAPAEAKENAKFAASYPVLQNVSETSASIAWALNVPSTGWVEWGPTPDLGKVARNSEFGLNPYDENFLSARITGLAPNTTYYYRTATSAFTYKTAYDKTASLPQYSDVYSFKTCGPNADEATFYVMNDTHNHGETIKSHVKRADEIKSDFILWNGDLCDFYMGPDYVKNFLANPTDTPYAAERPIVIGLGNHDRRGAWARNVKKFLTNWEHKEPEFYSLGYNYAFRQGPVAMILLDTGEDKPDWHPAWSEMANYEPYRELQTAWLAKTLEQPEIKSAPYLVAACHIPLYDPDAKANPGNILDQFATIQWPCAQLWGPLFEKYGVQLLIAAHLHRFGFSEATKDRPWAQVVGGGPDLARNATSLFVKATKTEMTVVGEKLSDGSQIGSWTFKPRV